MVSTIHVEPVSRSDQYKRVMKPLLERKRRARINSCLDELRDLLVSVLQAEGEAVTRLEKADILELTVRHVRRLSQRRRLTLPTPGVKHQQEREDVAKFQQGFVAAAQQVQAFLMNTNSLEPSVSNRLLSHLTNYATNITPSPPMAATQQTPSTSPVLPQSHPSSPVPCPQMPHPVVQKQSIVTKQISPSASPLHYVAPSVQVSNQQNRSACPTNSTPQQSSFQPCNKIPLQHSLPQPLIDLSNRQFQPNTTQSPIIREVHHQDRKVAPSPFIDVVSTENDFQSPPRQYQSIKSETPLASRIPSPNYDLSRVTLQLQTRVVASIASSQSGTKRSLESDDLKNKMHSASALRHLAAPEAASPPIPQDLSMKKFKQEDGQSSWRPW